jgi:hypothetical protein
MKRSVINLAYRRALACFERHDWALPPEPRWDVTDFGLNEFDRFGLTLVNLATEPEYCEKLMYARRGQKTLCHAHAHKKEDIICRWGVLAISLWGSRPTNEEEGGDGDKVVIPVNGRRMELPAGRPYLLTAGQRVTLVPGVWHSFAPASDECIIGEVSTANDDVNDNIFLDPSVGRFPGIEEDEPPQIHLVSE